jgi:uncharacterized membrane-anchored protein YhcB (DUF1043 family)
MNEIIVALITGGLALAGVIITNMSNAKKVEAQLEKNQAVTDTKLDNLTEEVKKHNNFAQKIPVIEEKINSIEHRLDIIEKE